MGARCLTATKPPLPCVQRINDLRCHHRTIITLLCTIVCVFFKDICTLYSGAPGSFLALSAEGHAGDPPVHHGASLGLERAPWRVLWAFKVAKSGK